MHPAANADRERALHASLSFARQPSREGIVDYLVSRGAKLQETLTGCDVLQGYGITVPKRWSRIYLFQFDRSRGNITWTPPTDTRDRAHAGAPTHASSRDLVLKEHAAKSSGRAAWRVAGMGRYSIVREAYGGAPTARLHRGADRTVHPDATDTPIISEAFVVALRNERYDSMEFLLERGFPVDYPSRLERVWQQSIV